MSGRARISHSSLMQARHNQRRLNPHLRRPFHTAVLQSQIERLNKRIASLKTRTLARQVRADSGPRLPRLDPRWFLLGIFSLLLAVPPALVVMERWRDMPEIHDYFQQQWCQVSDFLCATQLPSYFLIIIPCVIVLLLLFLWLAPARPFDFLAGARPEVASPSVLKNPPLSRAELPQVTLRLPKVAIGLPKGAFWLQVAAALIALASLLLGVLRQRIPGAELLLALLLYGLARLLVEWPSITQGSDLFGFLLCKLARVWPFILAPLVLILLLQSLYSTHRLIWLSGLATLALGLGLWRWRRRFNPVLWIMLLALALYTFRIDNWIFSVVGDEYDFFSYAKHIATEMPLGDILSHWFYGDAVYGSHPFFSSILQAISMDLFGMNNFGWRISSISLAALSIVFFYLFLRGFVSGRIALFTAFLLAASHYLMDFSKIGYNNLQALLAMALVLWLAGAAVHTRRGLAYTALGAALGFCFYLYPAALYVLPLPFLLLLFYDPPFNGPAFRRWLLTLAPLVVLFIPLLFQPQYWAAKLPGTYLNNPQLIQETGLAYHLTSNLLYSFFSYLFVPNESHFVVSSYVDPLSGILVTLGLAWLLKLAWREKFPRFMLLAFAAFLFMVGATHDREVPSNTRMFLLLPFWCLMAAAGLEWFTGCLRDLHVKPLLLRVGPVVALAAILAANLFQATVVMRYRTLGVPDLEPLFMRLLQRDEQMYGRSLKTYTFLTDADWGIDGIQTMQDAYGLPLYPYQLQRVEINAVDEQLPDVPALQNENNLVIVEPWIDKSMLVNLERQLVDIGKVPCVIRDAPGKDPRFVLWTSPLWQPFCPQDGDWEIK